MLLVGGLGGLMPIRDLGIQLKTLSQPGRDFMPITLQLAHPDLKT